MTKRKRTKMQAMFDKKTTLKTKDLATRTSLKYGCELGVCGEGLKKGNSSCSTSGTRHVTIAKIQRYAMKENKTIMIV